MSRVSTNLTAWNVHSKQMCALKVHNKIITINEGILDNFGSNKTNIQTIF